jgi:hypothetical protein
MNIEAKRGVNGWDGLGLGSVSRISQVNWSRGSGRRPPRAAPLLGALCFTLVGILRVESGCEAQGVHLELREVRRWPIPPVLEGSRITGLSDGSILLFSRGSSAYQVLDNNLQPAWAGSIPNHLDAIAMSILPDSTIEVLSGGPPALVHLRPDGALLGRNPLAH